jgi:hypothetical protein
LKALLKVAGVEYLMDEKTSSDDAEDQSRTRTSSTLRSSAPRRHLLKRS